MKYSIPSLLIAAGIVAGLFSLLADVLGMGQGGIQAAQLSVLLVSVILILLGIVMSRAEPRSGRSVASVLTGIWDRFQDLPDLLWVALGVLPAFVLFALAFMFFNAHQHTRYLEGYLPEGVPVGSDLRTNVAGAEAWFRHDPAPPFNSSPLRVVLLAPLLLLGAPANYVLLTTLTLASSFVLAALAWRVSDPKNHPVIVFLATISLFSFGLQFELERGQFYTITLLFGFLAVYIFHQHRDFRLLAYIFFCLAVQLKYYPLLLIVLLVDNWRDWNRNLRRFAALGSANFLLLFLLGPAYFLGFMNRMLHNPLPSEEISIRNHSIRSSAEVLGANGFGFLQGDALNWTREHTGFIAVMLYGFFLICFLAVVLSAYVRNEPGINVDLLSVCVVGGLVLPPISHDYTLPMLTVPFALAVSRWRHRMYPWPIGATIVLTAAIAFMYALTLFPFQYKPAYLQNNLPMLFLILAAVTILNVAGRRPSAENPD